MSDTSSNDPAGELERCARELRITRGQLRSLIDRNADAILVVDDEGIVRFANPAVQQLFGRTPAQLLGSQLGLPLVIGETTELDIVGAAGGEGVAEMRVVETEWGGDHARLAVLRDITERKRLEQERAQRFQEQAARAEAEQALRERDAFIALASHELKTPVSTLSATTQLLRRQLDRQGSMEPEHLRRALDRLEGQSRRLARLVDHLLDASTINSGKLVIKPEPVDLRGLVEQVVSSAQLTTDRHTITFSAPARLEAEVDPVRVEQVVSNLLDNAVKYSPNGGDIHVDLSVEGARACLKVRDHGEGIPEERRARLFERFYRGQPSGQVSGMGLGLFVSRHILELHGGSIRAESPPGGGALFIVLLPLQPAATSG